MVHKHTNSQISFDKPNSELMSFDFGHVHNNVGRDQEMYLQSIWRSQGPDPHIT